MKIKHIKHPYHPDEMHQEPIILILGFFDGVHRGHQAVIERAVRIGRQKKLKIALMTFNRHPAIVYETFSPENYHYLTLPDEKQQIVSDLGVDYYYEIEFNSDFGHLSPQDFVDQYIVGWQADTVVAGFDYTYGPAEIANMETLPSYAKGRFSIECVAPQKIDNEPVSSTAIKKAINQGDVSFASKQLGYIYKTRGFVIHGAGRGHQLGYPTANVFTDPPYQLLPGIGVYAVKVKINGEIFEGMASIGYNVTFDKLPRPSVEVNIFDFDQQIYGNNIEIYWHQYLRGELKFASASDLVSQLKEDEKICQDYFKTIQE